MPVSKYNIICIKFDNVYFRSTQKQAINTNPALLDPDSVQGALEIALTKIGFTNVPFVNLSSR